MKCLRALFCLAALAIVCSSAAAQAKVKKPIRVLFLGDQGPHQPALRARQITRPLYRRYIRVTYVDDVKALNAETLSRFDCLLVYANIDKISPQQEAALLAYVEGGGGLVALHCASYCFQNSDKYIQLVGGQFKSHKTGTFRVANIAAKHPVMQGFGGFESWDETYVHHRHHEKDRTVLEVRVEGEQREPWTWVRTHGKGRVFYTAWGHDERTWGHAGFQNLVQRGIRWACGKDVSEVPGYGELPSFVAPEMTPPRKDVKPFEYVDVGPKIPNYAVGSQKQPLTQMQKPLSAEESLKHFVTPQGFHVELFADQRNFQGKPIAMNWDERGRLWICETVDYPNELQSPGKGRDRIRICQDTDGDGRADKFTLFAEELSIPTAIAFYRGGAIVQDGTQTLYLKDTNGDDKADVRKVLIRGWALGDTHGGVSNFRYGLDNWFWGMQGYNNSAPEYDFDEAGKPRKKSQPFRMGFFRFKLDANDPPNVVELEFIRSTNNNTWGLGFSEEGLVFGSTANHNPSVYMPIANRFYERVRGWSPQQLGTIADTHKFQPITDKVRQVDQHGGYTAAAGHALYTARRYPQPWWNRTAFVCGPTGHLVGTFVLSRNSTNFSSTSPCNLLASNDEWSAPIAAEVGPDGNVWVLDWYNYIVQHNPTPHGFKTGKGNAYESDLRDKKHGRIYRVVYSGDDEDTQAHGPRPVGSNASAPSQPTERNESKSHGARPVGLENATGSQLVAALKSDNMLWRLHAQRLLAERGKQDVVAELIELVRDESVDAAGLNVGAIHALWTLKALDAIPDRLSAAYDAVFYAFQMHPSPGVRRNAVLVLPPWAGDVIVKGLEDDDPHVRLAALLALADTAGGNNSAGADLAAEMCRQENCADPLLLDAATSAGAVYAMDFLAGAAYEKANIPQELLPRLSIVAEHWARGRPSFEDDAIYDMMLTLKKDKPQATAAIVAGLAKGWPKDHRDKPDADQLELLEKDVAEVLAGLPPQAQGPFLKLASFWGSQGFEKHSASIVKALRASVADEAKPAAVRISAARQLVELRPADGKLIDTLLEQITPRTSPELADGLIQACGLSQADTLGKAIVVRMSQWTPHVKAAGIRALLSQPAATAALLDGIEKGTAYLSDMTLDQKAALSNHPNKDIAARATRLLERGGGLPDPDRVKVLEELLPLVEKKGDAEAGKLVFKKHCAKCHRHGTEGENIGPDLTGMAVHPKAELLTNIIDPSRSVEGNFRTYTIVTVEGRIHTGMLAAETKTSLQLVDAEAKRHDVLREDIDELIPSAKSLMPEGFEKQMTPGDIANLLEMLTQRGKFLPLDLRKAATIISTRGMFYSEAAAAERLVFPDWSPKTFEGVSFQLVDPQGDRVPNVILLHGPNGKFPPKMPKSVALAVNAPAKAIHLLSGVSGWGHPLGSKGSVSMIVRLHYDDGKTEDHELKNGIHFADYIRRVDVPESKLAFMLRNQQMRYLAVHPQRAETIERIELVKGPDSTAPMVMAITVEMLEK